MALTDVKVKKAKAEDRRYRIADGDGLYLDVRTSGKKGWLFRYQLNGKRNAISLGGYPAISLQDARIERNRCRALLAKGIDPAAEKRAAQAQEEGPSGNLRRGCPRVDGEAYREQGPRPYTDNSFTT